MDEFWSLPFLYGQFVSSALDLYGMLTCTSIRHVRGNDNALQVVAQLSPIAPTGKSG
jgi:hypothetical protein